MNNPCEKRCWYKNEDGDYKCSLNGQDLTLGQYSCPKYQRYLGYQEGLAEAAEMQEANQAWDDVAPRCAVCGVRNCKLSGHFTVTESKMKAREREIVEWLRSFTGQLGVVIALLQRPEDRGRERDKIEAIQRATNYLESWLEKE